MADFVLTIAKLALIVVVLVLAMAAVAAVSNMQIGTGVLLIWLAGMALLVVSQLG